MAKQDMLVIALCEQCHQCHIRENIVATLKMSSKKTSFWKNVLEKIHFENGVPIGISHALLANANMPKQVRRMLEETILDSKTKQHAYQLLLYKKYFDEKMVKILLQETEQNECT